MQTMPLGAFLFSLLIYSYSFAQIEKSNKPLSPAKKNLTMSSPIQAPAHAKIPPLKKGEYAVFITDAYVIFKTQKIENLELDTKCFKNNKPQCEAYAMAKIKPKDIESLGGATNLAAVNCENMNGRNMIAVDMDRNEYNFCRYKDGSMVNSWSMYKYHNPVPVIK